MSTIHVKMLVGPYAGRVASFQQPLVSFGRAANLPIPIPLETISRHHGDLQLQEDGSWAIINHSNNGTTVNGRKVKKPRILKSGDIISIAKQQMFEVSIEAKAPAPAAQQQAPAAQASTMMGQAMHGQGMAQAADALSPDQAGQAEAESKGEQAKRSKMWMMLALYMVGMGVVIFVLLSVYRESNAIAAEGPKPLEKDEVKKLILAHDSIVEPNMIRDANEVNTYLNYARNHKRLFDINAQNSNDAYKAYVNYTLAQYHNGIDSNGNKNRLDVVDRNNYIEITEFLADRINEIYKSALVNFENKRYKLAASKFKLIRLEYPNYGSKIIENVEAFETYIIKNKKKSGSNLF